MNIAIIEKGHFEVAYTLISLFDTGDNTITIFSDEASYHQLVFLLRDKAGRYTWVIQRKESNRHFIQTIFSHISGDKFDLLYFNTIADNFILYAWYIRSMKQENIVLTLHDVNGFFQYRPSWSIRRMIRYAGKRMLIKTIPCFNVLSETMVTYLQRKTGNKRKILNIPGSFFDPAHNTAREYGQHEPIMITIPGSVDERRRDYHLLFPLLQEAQARRIRLTITLLGGFRKNHSEKIYAECRQYLQSNSNLLIYETPIVPQAEFDRVMAETHFIWMPLQSPVVVTDGTVEEYGISISSGNTADAIRYAKPFFAPVHFNMDDALNKSCIRFRNIADITEVLTSLTPTTYADWQHRALNASMNYTLDKITGRTDLLFR